MPASKAETVAARVAVVLAGAATGALAVYSDRNDALTRTESPVILVELVDEDSRAFADGPVIDEDLLRFQVCVCVRSDSWRTVADAVRVAAHAALVADATLQALLGYSLRRDRAEWRSADTDVPFGYCNQIYQCKYLTRNQGLDL